MNAYELADELQKFYDELDGSFGYLEQSINILRQQADRIAELEKGGCGNCHACLVGVMQNGYPVTMQRMILCPDCGNKRCPKASNHRHQCTGSNEPNQRGSIYTTPQIKPLNNDETEDLIKELTEFMTEDSYTELDKIVLKTVNTLRRFDRQVSALEKDLFMLQRHYDQLDSSLKGVDK